MINKVVLVGKYFVPKDNQEYKFLTASIMLSKGYKDNEGKTVMQFIPIKISKKGCYEFANEYVKEKDIVSVVGCINCYKDRDGKNSFNVLVDEINILSKAQDTEQEQEPRATTIRKEDIVVDLQEQADDDDLPF